MNINYEKLFNFCIKMSNRWVSMSNTVVAVALLYTLFNLAFLFSGHTEYISEHQCFDRLYLVAFGMIAIALIFAMTSFFAARKLRSE
ncbi:hypothetical protein ACFOEW_13050 [Alteromonas oceani]|uniref:Uncharacterized protein n=1 Tax=Alteromonas oceani TaxID=2071609 RepID=A0ABV7K1A8_9ALTE|nr:hypothetical protein [Alteromonas oceani]